MTKRLLAVFAVFASSTLLSTGLAAADPATPTTLTYHFTECSGPAGSPTTFDAVKQPGQSAALHLVDGRGTFVAMEAIDVASGTVLFTTRGFEHNVVPTITCQIIHPVSLTLQSVTGIIAPVN